MKWIPLSVIIISILIFAILGYAHSQSTLALQEKCAEGAKKFFFERIQSYWSKWGEFKNGEDNWKNEFLSHYNKNLDKCFIRIEWEHWKVPIDKYGWDYHISVYDVFGGLWIGGYDSDKIATGKGLYLVKGKGAGIELLEFQALIKPYREE